MTTRVTGTYSRAVTGGTGVWEQANLIVHASSLPTKHVPLTAIAALDSTMWFGGPNNVRPTIREVVNHVQRILAADLSYPIILAADGSLMDGAHRLAKAHMEGRIHIAARQFVSDPPPDRVI